MPSEIILIAAITIDGFIARRNDEIIIVITSTVESLENEINGKPIKNTPFAGVGRPKKQDFVGKVLNLANLIIENIRIKNAKNGVYSKLGD